MLKYTQSACLFRIYLKSKVVMNFGFRSNEKKTNFLNKKSEKAKLT